MSNVARWKEIIVLPRSSAGENRSHDTGSETDSRIKIFRSNELIFSKNFPLRTRRNHYFWREPFSQRRAHWWFRIIGEENREALCIFKRSTVIDCGNRFSRVLDRHLSADYSPNAIKGVAITELFSRNNSSYMYI